MTTIVLTGASDGIGAVAASMLAARDVELVIVGRSPEKTRAVAEQTGARFHTADFSRLGNVLDPASVLATEHDSIEMLANNARGLFSGPQLTEDGFERTFQVDHLAPFLLTHLLMDRLLAGHAAVVNTASVGARLFGRPDLDDVQTLNSFSANRAYGNAKLANILFTKGLHDRYAAQGLSSVAFHPGVIATNFASDGATLMNRLYQGPAKRFLTSPQQAAATLLHFVTGQPGRDWFSRQYYSDRLRISRTHRAASDPRVVRAHWEQSADLLRDGGWLD